MANPSFEGSTPSASAHSKEEGERMKVEILRLPSFSFILLDQISVAQRKEHLITNQKVVGSIPTRDIRLRSSTERASGFYPEGYRFESYRGLRLRHLNHVVWTLSSSG